MSDKTKDVLSTVVLIVWLLIFGVAMFGGIHHFLMLIGLVES